MPYSLILDFLVAILLVITIAFAFVLNKRLGKLRGDREAFEKLAETFNESTSRAEEGINTLHQTTNFLQERLDKAQSLRDDLTFLIERGDRTADKLEKIVRATRENQIQDVESNALQSTLPEIKSSKISENEEGGPGLASETSQSAIETDVVGDEKSEAEQELLKAIRSSG